MAWTQRNPKTIVLYPKHWLRGGKNDSGLKYNCLDSVTMAAGIPESQHGMHPLQITQTGPSVIDGLGLVQGEVGSTRYSSLSTAATHLLQINNKPRLKLTTRIQQLNAACKEHKLRFRFTLAVGA